MHHLLPNSRNALTTAVCTAVAAVAVAGPAAAQEGHSLSLTGPPTAETGKTTVIQAQGTVPADVMLNRYLNVYAIPAEVVSTCPPTFQNAMQLAYASSAEGGDTVALSVPAEGNFSIPVAYTPHHAGVFVLCGYVHEGVETMAMAQHDISVAGGPSGGAKPENIRRPAIKRSGSRLVCSRGKWSGDPTSYAFHWRVDGKRKAGATGRKLRVTRGLRGKRVRCGVKAANGAGSTTALSKTVRA
jgi:hypothetical protein